MLKLLPQCVAAAKGRISHLSHSLAHIKRVEISPVKGVHPIPPVLLIVARILCEKGTGSGSQLCTPHLHPSPCLWLPRSVACSLLRSALSACCGLSPSQHTTL